MRDNATRLIALCLLLTLQVVPASQVAAQPGVGSSQFVDPHPIVLDWLECGECQAGQEQALLQLGRTAFSHLEVAFSKQWIDARTRTCEATATRVYEGLRSYHPRDTDIAWVGLDRDAYIRMYCPPQAQAAQRQAVRGFVSIGGIEAWTRLRRIADMNLALDNDVRTELNAAILVLAPP
jgi:hypothetical protein